MTARRQSFAASGLEIAIGSVLSIGAAQLFCALDGLPIALAVKLNLEIYAASFAIRFGLRRWFERRRP